MNREILFRGKVRPLAGVDGGYWVYGYLVGDSIAYPRDPNEIVYEKVIPETVGQYTGLKDKNGKGGFDGDKVSHPHGVATIVWLHSSWVLDFGKGDIDDRYYNLEALSESEVIGNIHEQVEALK